MSGRFNLDPRAQRPPPTPPPATAKPAQPGTPVRPATPPAPGPLPTAKRAPVAPAPASRRNLLVVLVLVGALVVAGGAAAVYYIFLESYPEKYLVKEDETPSGMRIATLSASELDALAMDDNPGEIDQAELEDRFSTSDGRAPEEGWGEVLATGGDRLALFALRYEDEDAARDAGRTLATVCGFASGAVLRDGDVLVVIVPEGASRANVLALVDAVRDKASGLKPVCGTA